MPENVSFHRISRTEFNSRVSTNDVNKKLQKGGLYFVYEDATPTKGLIYQVTDVTGTTTFTATTTLYGHEGVVQRTGNSDSGKVPVLNGTGYLDNGFFQFIDNGKIADSYIPSLYLNEFKGEFTDKDTLEALTTSSVDGSSQPRDIAKGDWAIVTSDQNAAYNGPYICTNITSSGSSWKHIGSPYGTLVTEVSSSSTNAQIPTALAVQNCITSAVTGGALKWDDIPDSSST